MRTTSEIYLMLHNHIKDKKQLYDGLCMELHWLGLTSEETKMIKNHIRTHMPVRYIDEDNIHQSAYGWPMTDEGLSERKQWVYKMIK